MTDRGRVVSCVTNRGRVVCCVTDRGSAVCMTGGGVLLCD